MLWTVSAGRAQLAGMLSSGYWALWSFHFTFYEMKENLCSCRQSMAQAWGYNRLYFTVTIPSLKEDCLFLHLSFNCIYPWRSNPKPLRVTGFSVTPFPCFLLKLVHHYPCTQVLFCLPSILTLIHHQDPSPLPAECCTVSQNDPFQIPSH